jgi:hypothetical protein
MRSPLTRTSVKAPPVTSTDPKTSSIRTVRGADGSSNTSVACTGSPFSREGGRSPARSRMAFRVETIAIKVLPGM